MRELRLHSVLVAPPAHLGDNVMVRRLASLLILMVACSSSPSARPVDTSSTSTATVAADTTSITSRPAADIGPELEASHLPALPETGVALEVDGFVVLIGFDGEVLGHLPGFTIDYRISVPGPVSLYDDQGVGWVLDPPELYRSGDVPLAHGGFLRMPPIGVVAQRGAELIQNELKLTALARESVLVGAGRETVTFGWPAIDKTAPPLLVDLSIGMSTDAPVNCGGGAGAGDSIHLVCASFGSGDSNPTIETLENGDRALLTGSVGQGHWRWIIPSPDRSVVLAQWSGECGVPHGFWIENGTPVTITGTPLDASPESMVIGWSPDGTAVAILFSAVCGTGADRPGVYLATAPGDLRILYATDGLILNGQVWQRLAA